MPSERVDAIFVTGDVCEVDYDLKWDDIRNIERCERQFESFCEWLSKQNSTHKILIGGNHELCSVEFMKEQCQKYEIIWLHKKSISIDSIKIYGDSGYPAIGMGHFGYYQDENYWKDIPIDTDILLTHGPPEHFGDNDEYPGCPELLRKISELDNLKLVLCGHNHDGIGEYEYKNRTVINSATILKSKTREI